MQVPTTKLKTHFNPAVRPISLPPLALVHEAASPSRVYKKPSTLAQHPPFPFVPRKACAPPCQGYTWCNGDKHSLLLGLRSSSILLYSTGITGTSCFAAYLSLVSGCYVQPIVQHHFKAPHLWGLRKHKSSKRSRLLGTKQIAELFVVDPSITVLVGKTNQPLNVLAITQHFPKLFLVQVAVMVFVKGCEGDSAHLLTLQYIVPSRRFLLWVFDGVVE